MKYVLLLDTETSGLEPEAGARCIEIGCMLYDIELASPMASFSSLMYGESNEAIHVNGITAEQLKDAPDPKDVWPTVQTYAGCASAIVAHRAEFDSKFVPVEVCGDLPWICSKADIDWPEDRRGDHLVHLALAYGLGVVSVHRAMTDVDTMARIFTRIAERGHSLEKLLMHAMRPKKRFVALVPFEQKDLAKKHGFFWDKEKREWYRRMPPEDVDNLPFEVREG